MSDNESMNEQIANTVIIPVSEYKALKKKVRSSDPACYGEWQSIETLTLNENVVLLHSKEWIDEDFNPKGIREGFRNEDDDGPIVSARWNNCVDCWVTVINEEATHWMRQPNAP